MVEQLDEAVAVDFTSVTTTAHQLNGFATPDAYGTGTGGGGGDSGGGGTPGEIELLNDLTDVNAIPTASNDSLSGTTQLKMGRH